MWRTSAPTRCATTGSPLCSQASRSVRCPSPIGPATIAASRARPARRRGEPLGPVPEPDRPGHDRGFRREPTVPILVGELTGHGEFDPRRPERADQPVHVAAERAPVGRHTGRIDEYSKCHDLTSSLRLTCLAKPTPAPVGPTSVTTYQSYPAARRDGLPRLDRLQLGDGV